MGQFHDAYVKRMIDQQRQGDFECEDVINHTQECHDFGEGVQARFLDDRLAYLYWSFQSDDYQSIIEGLRNKYGAPALVTRQHLQNRMGAKFVGTDCMWTDALGITLLTHQYTQSLDQSSVSLANSTMLARFKKLRPKPTPDI